MKKVSCAWVSVLFFFLLLAGAAANAQLRIETGTAWVSDSSTQVVLDSIGIRYTAHPIELGNTFQFTGAKDASIESDTMPVFSSLLLNTPDHQLILYADITIASKVSFKTGLFNLNNHVVNLNAAAYIDNEQETSRFIDTANGSIYISVNVNLPKAVNPGNLGVVFSSASYSGNLAIERGHQPQAVSGSALNSIARYYTIYTEDKGGIDATLRLNYFDVEKRGLDESTFSMWQQNGAGAWKNAGFTSRNTTLNYTEQNGFNGFGKFTLAAAGITPVPPPVTAITLSGIWKSNQALLTWNTPSEINNDHFDVERKYPADTGFIKIAAVPSKYADGNATIPSLYLYVDAAVNSNIHDIQYRIKEVTKDGRLGYSNSISLNPVTGGTFIIKSYPTIGTGASIYIQVGNLPVTTMQVKICDLFGRELLTRSLIYQSQSLPLPFLPYGVYRMMIQSGSWNYHCTFVK